MVFEKVSKQANITFTAVSLGRYEKFLKPFLLSVQSFAIIIPLGCFVLAYHYPCSSPFFSNMLNTYSLPCYRHFKLSYIIESYMWFEAIVYAVHYYGLVLPVLQMYCLKFLSLVELTPQRQFPYINIASLRVLENVLNSSLSWRLYFNVIMFGALTQCVAGSGSVLLKNQLSLGKAKALFLSVYCVESVLGLIILLYIPSRIHWRSLNLFSRTRKYIRDPWEKRVARSWKPLKIKFGDSFVDSLTPLRIERNVLCQTMRYVILYKSKKLY